MSRRVSPANIPIFTRDARETVTAYLVHFSRSVRKAFREHREVINANEQQLDAERMRSWFFDRYEANT